MATSPAWLNVLDYASIQDAVNAAALQVTGGAVYVPPNTYTAAGIPPTNNAKFLPPLTFPSNKPIRLVGDGPRVSVLQHTGASSPDNVDLVQIQGDYQSVEGVTLQGSGSTAGSGAGVRIRSGASSIIYRTSVIN